MQDIDIALLIALNVFLHSVLSQILLYKALWQENKDITVPLNLC